MRALAPAAIAALESRNITVRDFLWIEGHVFGSDTIAAAGFWSDLGTVSAQVLDPRTGGTQTRTFEGAGGLVDISPIVLSASLTVQTVTISLSQIANPNQLVRGYDVKQARVEIFRGLFNPATLVQLSPAFPRFVGFVDQAEITTPSEGSEGQIVLTCMSHSQEMSRSNTATRSDADIRARDAADSFGRHCANVGTWQLFWGRETGQS